MAGIKALIFLALAGSIGILFLVLGCALPHYNSWWPLFVLFFYALAPLPLVIGKRYQDDVSVSSALVELAYFLTTGVVVSAFGLPIVLAHVRVIKWAACGLVLAGNVVTFGTISSYFYIHRDEEFSYGGMF